MEVLLIAFVLYLCADTASRGKLGAVVRGTGKGVARTGYRAAREGARKSAENYSTFLHSDAAPLRRTRKTARVVGRPVGKGARASWTGARDGVREELKKLREQIDAARAELEQRLAEQQNPAVGVTKGKLGHSFDVMPKLVDNPAPAPAPAPARVPVSRETATPAASNGAPGTQPEGITMTATTTTGTGGPHVEVHSLPGFIAACDTLAGLIVSVSEQATSELKLGPGAQAGLADAGDAMRAVAAEARKVYAALIEAADNTPQGAEQVTVGQARNE